jgi:hypothetical protein
MDQIDKMTKTELLVTGAVASACSGVALIPVFATMLRAQRETVSFPNGLIFQLIGSFY